MVNGFKNLKGKKDFETPNIYFETPNIKLRNNVP